MTQVANQPAEYAFSKRQVLWAMVAIFAVYGAGAYIIQTLNVARPQMAADLSGMSLYAWSVSLPGLVGAIPTVNTMVIQNAIPKRLLGVAMGGIFFVISMGVAISPALLGSAMNASYAKALAAQLPAELTRAADAATMTTLGDPKVLLSQPAMAALEESFRNRGGDGPDSLQKNGGGHPHLHGVRLEERFLDRRHHHAARPSDHLHGSPGFLGNRGPQQKKFLRLSPRNMESCVYFVSGAIRPEPPIPDATGFFRADSAWCKIKEKSFKRNPSRES